MIVIDDQDNVWRFDYETNKFVKQPYYVKVLHKLKTIKIFWKVRVDDFVVVPIQKLFKCYKGKVNPHDGVRIEDFLDE